VSTPTDLHLRTVSLESRSLDGGCRSVHAELRDVRRVDMRGYLGVSHPAGVVHHMALDVVLDRELVVRDSKAWMGTVPFEHGPKTRGEGCRDIVPSYLKLVGTKVDASYAARVLELVGGTSGCFHVLSLAQCLPLAIEAAGASGASEFRRTIRVRAVTDASLRLGMSGALEDSPSEAAARTADLMLWLAVPGFRITAAEGRVASAAVASAGALAELSIIKGFTGAALEKLGRGEGSRELAALVIAVTPVVPQASGALAGFLKLSPEQKLRAARAGNPQADSCHMWRTGGPLMTADA
jgi:DUF2889 family protein